MGHERPGHGDALPLTAGELVRVAALQTGQAHRGEHVAHPLPAFPAAQAFPGQQTLLHRGAHRAAGIEGRERVLKDHLDASGRHAARSGRRQRRAPEQDAAAGGTLQTASQTAQRGLAAAGFAHQPEALAGPQDKIHPVHGPQMAHFAQHALTHREVAAHIFQRQQIVPVPGLHHRPSSTCASAKVAISLKMFTAQRSK